jgi:hypothetical protein
MGLDKIVKVNVSRQTATVSEAGFGVLMVLGSSTSLITKGKAIVITDPSDLLDPSVGLSSSAGEYIAAVKYFGQSPKPSQMLVGRRLDPIIQVVTVTPNVSSQTVQHFIQTIDGVAYDFLSDITPTAAEVVTGLAALINADAACKVTASGTTTLILTADNTGIPFTHSESPNLAAVLTTANVGIPETLASISNDNDDWYALVADLSSDLEVLAAAADIEAKAKLLGFSTNAAAILDPLVTTDIFSKLKAKAYTRTFGLYSGDAANYPEAAMFGKFLPYAPGSELWENKTLAGVTVDKLKSAQIAAIEAKGGNYYIKLGGNNVCQGGKVFSGEWIDVIRLIDLIVARTQEAVFGKLLRLPKVPFTNGGISSVEVEVKGVLKTQQKIGGIAPDDVDADGNLVPGFVTNFPLAASVSANDKAARKLTGAKATARLAGAIHAVVLDMAITV